MLCNAIGGMHDLVVGNVETGLRIRCPVSRCTCCWASNHGPGNESLTRKLGHPAMAVGVILIAPTNKQTNQPMVASRRFGFFFVYQLTKMEIKGQRSAKRKRVEETNNLKPTMETEST